MTEIKRHPGNRIMGKGYARALRVVFNGFATWKTIAADLNLGRRTAQDLCGAFCDAGLAHVLTYVRATGNARTAATAIYAFGPGTDAIRPPGGTVRKPGPLPVELLTFCNGVKDLMVASHNGKTFSDAVGYSHRTGREVLRALKAEALIHIDGYTPHATGGDGYPTYTWGPDQADVRKRAPQPAHVLWARGNAVKKEKLAHTRLLRAMVLAKPIDGRSCAQNPAHFPKGQGSRAAAPKSEPVPV